ncbi:DNA-directed RNA polymerase sigma-70 factor [Bacteroidia bacterium]|nr:DNA-directed RNA polymerase sigma-70 factor [Bacteroidia bacterium]
MSIASSNILSDYELWMAFKKGNKDSFSVLYKRHYASMYRYGAGMGIKDESVQDAIQEVFLRLYFNTSFNIIGTDLKFYLLRAVRNQLLDMRKSKKEFVEAAEQKVPEFILHFTVEDQLMAAEEQKRLSEKANQLLSHLTNRQKEIIYLHYIEELDYKGIAALTNLNIQSVRNIVCKAMERLKGNGKL